MSKVMIKKVLVIKPTLQTLYNKVNPVTEIDNLNIRS